MKNQYIKINPADNVAVALSDLKAGTQALGVTLCEDIPRGHKFTLKALKAGDDIIKYGFPTGHVTVDKPDSSSTSAKSSIASYLASMAVMTLLVNL